MIFIVIIWINLTQMLEQINNIKNNGKTYEEAKKELGEDLGKQYIKDKKKK